MEKIDIASAELREMDSLAALQSPVHALNPAAKLFITILYILLTVSFNKYDLSGLSIMVLYPVFMFQLSGIPVSTCFRKLRVVLPLVCAVGLFNPIFDHTPMLRIGTLIVTGGVISMLTLMLKGIFCLMASFILAATTGIDSLCAALRRLHVPQFIVTLLLLTFRYIGVMMDEVSVMTTAYKLRAPGEKGIRFSAWGSFLGQLLLRSMDRAGELYESMQLRGFAGEFRYAERRRAVPADYLFTVLCAAALILLRSFNIADLLGRMIMGG